MWQSLWPNAGWSLPGQDEVRTTAARAAGRPDAAEGCAMDLDVDASGEAVSLEFLLEKDQREILKDLSEDTAMKLEEWRDYLGGMVDQPLVDWITNLLKT